MGITAGAMRKRLEAYVDTRNELEMQALRLDQKRQQVGDIKSPKYEPTAAASSTPGNPVARDVIALERLEERVAELTAQERSEHEALELIISRVTNAQQRALLRMRYFDLMEWPDIAFSFYGDSIDYITEEREYVTKCYRLHTRAVSSMCSVQRRLIA